MKAEQRKTLLLSILLSEISAWGGIRCLISGFSLEVDTGVILASAFLAATGGGLLARKRWGGTALLFLTAGLLGYLSRQAEVRNQCLSLVHRIAAIYDSAYGWGIPSLPAYRWTEAAEIPLSIYASLTAYSVSRLVSSRKNSAAASFLVGLPLGLCLVVTDTVPDTLSLGILLAMIGLIFLTDSIRQDSIQQAGRLLRRALLPTVAVLSLLFLIYPKDRYVNHAEQYRTRLLSAAEQLSDRVNGTKIPFDAAIVQSGHVALSELDRQNGQNQTVAQVTSDTTGTLYLRSMDYDVYTGKDWESTPGRRETFAGQGQPTANVTVSTNAILDTLLLPYYPEPGTELRDGRIRNEHLLRQYSFSVYPAGPAHIPPENDTILPESCRQELEALTAQLTGGTAEPAVAAVLIGNYVSRQAVYDKNTPAMPENETDFALWFLNRSETGYCVHFATAAAVMMRSLNIPARYVTGYKVDAIAGQSVNVTTGDAHAWVEYYDRTASCWYVLEATPGADYIAPSVPETAPTEQTEPTATEPEKTEVTEGAGGFPIWLPVIALLIAAVPLRRKLIVALRRRKQAAGTANQRALAAWQETKLLAGLRKRPAPEALKSLALKAKFSQHLLTDAELGQFAAYRKEAVADLQTEPKWKQFIDKYYYCGY